MSAADTTDGERPSLRDERKSSTTERILVATAELVHEHGSIDVPLTAVAARAGIGERTLYRYFATKADLFTALFGWMTRATGGGPTSPGAEGLLDSAARFFAAYEEHPEIIRALSAEKPAELRAGRAEQRRAAVATALAAEVDGVPEPRRTQVLAAVHLLTSSDAFLHANDFWGLGADEVTAMVRWAVGTLLDGVDRPGGDVVSADGWVAPGPGSWVLDDLHKATTYTPAFVGVAAAAIGDGFAEIGRRYGLPFERLEVGVVRNRTYGRMVITGAPAPRAGKAEQPPPAVVLKVLARVHPALRRRTAAAAAATAERRWLREAEAWWADERAPQLEANAALQARIVAAGSDAVAPADLAVLVEDAAANLRHGVLRHFRLIGVQLGVTRLQLLLAEHGVDAGVALDLLSGASPATSASRAALDEARAELARTGATGPWASLAEVRSASPRAADLVEEHLAAYGHRTVGESDVDGLTLGECPWIVLAALGAPPHEPASASTDAVEVVRDRLPVGARAAFDEALVEARTCYAVREDEVGIDMSWGVGLLRHALLLAGAALVADGRLSRPTDAFELTTDETAALLRGDAAPARDDIDARRAQREADDAADAPPWLGSPPVAPPPADVFPPAMAAMVAAFGAIRRHIDVAPGPAGPAGSGIGIGARAYEGRARVAVSPDELLVDLEPGDVLVTSITTPAFNAVLPMLGAIVTERGGLLSHPAIAARELNIPAVIGAAGVLATIADGATVVVDPIAGTVTVAERTALERTRSRG